MPMPSLKQGAVEKSRDGRTASTEKNMSSCCVVRCRPLSYQGVSAAVWHRFRHSCARFVNPHSYSGSSEEHTSELQSLMRISYAAFCLTKKKPTITPLALEREKSSTYDTLLINHENSLCLTLHHTIK